MGHLSVISITACAAVILGSAVHAQQQPASPPPPPAIGAPITLEQAKAAIAAGMAPLLQCGLDAVLAGETTVEEVVRSVRAET